MYTTKEKKMNTKVESTKTGIYHIHLDTQTTSAELHQKIHKELGFFSHNFTGHPEGYPHFEPTSHSTIKLESKLEFEEIWKKTIKLVEKDKDVVGYLEGEYIPTDRPIPFKEMSRFFPPPFTIKRRKIDPEKGEGFRETEFHLVMDFDNSEHKVITALLEAGLYGALLQKLDHRAIILTCQGRRRLIKPLFSEIVKYLNDIGGVKRCTIKEEVALKHELFNMSENELPEVVDSITYI